MKCNGVLRMHLAIVVTVLTLLSSVSAAPHSTVSHLKTSLSENVNLTQLARDTVQFCYTPHKHEEECKLYVFASTFASSWQLCRDYCQSLGEVLGVPMDLVAMESREENQLIGDHLLENYPEVSYWWTSGNDITVPYFYVWASTGYAFTYVDWKVNEPHDARDPNIHRNAEPGVLLDSRNGIVAWTDWTLDKTLNALCEQND